MSKKVLVIDDDENHRKIYSDILSRRGYDVYSASEATEGLFLTQDNKPNLILLDIMLPGEMNGMEFLTKIKSNPELSKIPVIALTNLDTERESALAAGAAKYVVKANHTPQEIAEMVKDYLKA